MNFGCLLLFVIVPGDCRYWRTDKKPKSNLSCHLLPTNGNNLQQQYRRNVTPPWFTLGAATPHKTTTRSIRLTPDLLGHISKPIDLLCIILKCLSVSTKIEKVSMFTAWQIVMSTS